MTKVALSLLADESFLLFSANRLTVVQAGPRLRNKQDAISYFRYNLEERDVKPSLTTTTEVTEKIPKVSAVSI
jgi:hypothetical protein